SFSNHCCLRVSCVTLYSLDITTAQLQFVCSAGMAKAMKHNRFKVVFSDEFIEGIPYLRVVVNYLISETVEQYYQEVGRGGRDGQPAYGYLLYTNQSKRGRMMLLNNSQ
ncbi:MAG: hypothetical protein IKS63_02405, partial [Firmicutes bacterium]|nr:hypothetical protein [Bacillota bacterium]